MDAELVYEKKYSQEKLSNLCHTTQVIMGETEPSSLPPSFDAFYKKLVEDTVCVIIPPRAALEEVFIQEAIDVSELYKIDIRIEKRTSHIVAMLSFDYGGNMLALNPILSMADDYSFSRGTNGRDLTISLDFYTHAVYRNGHLVAPENINKYT